MNFFLAFILTLRLVDSSCIDPVLTRFENIPWFHFVSPGHYVFDCLLSLLLGLKEIIVRDCLFFFYL